MALRRAARGEQQAQALVQRTWEAHSRIQDILVRVLDAESAVREFRLTGDERVLRPYFESRASLPALSDRVAYLFEKDPLKSRRAIEVRELVRNELNRLSGMCEGLRGSTRGRTGLPGGAVLSAADDASRLVRIRLTALETEVDGLLRLHSRNAEDARLRVVAVVVELILAGVFFQLVVTLVLTSAISGQIRALDTNARLVCQGLPERFMPLDTREMHELGARLEDVAALLADRERKLRTSEEQFRILFKEAPIAYHEIDRHGVIRHINNAELALLGMSREDLVGQFVWNTAAPEFQERVRRYVVERLTERQPTTPYECEYQCRDDSLVTVEVHENLVRDRQGRVIGIRSALLDITARKMVEMASKKVEQYARELKTKNEELLLALKVARAANATKGRFLAAMSHELRTPLNGIIGLAELMHDGIVGAVTPEHKEYLGDILASSQHLLQLVNDLLDLAKVDSGKMEFRLETVELAPLLREVHDVLQIMADKKKITVTIEIDRDLHTVVSDGARLKQVVYNYLSNGIKFTPEKGKVQIRAKRTNPATFCLEIEDNGPGIPRANIHMLFADFQQLGAAPNQGTGLGLALTKRIVEAMGGRVGVQSVVGSGSLFYAAFPTAPKAVTSDASPPALEAGMAPPETAAVFTRIPRRPEIPQSS